MQCILRSSIQLGRDGVPTALDIDAADILDTFGMLVDAEDILGGSRHFAGPFIAPPIKTKRTRVTHRSLRYLCNPRI